MPGERAASRAAAACTLALASLGGCIASNVVAPADRSVTIDVADLAWAPVAAADLSGLFESVEIQGDAASQLWKVYYLFEPDGRYTGAALAVGADGPRFQTIDGGWRLDAAGIVLDANAPVPITGARDHLRLEAPSGTVVLRRVGLQ